MKLAEFAARMFSFQLKIFINLTPLIPLSIIGRCILSMRGEVVFEEASSLQPSHDKRLLF